LEFELRLPLLQNIGTVQLARITGLLLTRDPMTPEEPPKGADRNVDVPPLKIGAELAQRYAILLFKQI